MQLSANADAIPFLLVSACVPKESAGHSNDKPTPFHEQSLSVRFVFTELAYL
jgi:hypothetical protein